MINSKENFISAKRDIREVYSLISEKKEFEAKEQKQKVNACAKKIFSYYERTSDFTSDAKEILNKLVFFKQIDWLQASFHISWGESVQDNFCSVFNSKIHCAVGDVFDVEILTYLTELSNNDPRISKILYFLGKSTERKINLNSAIFILRKIVESKCSISEIFYALWGGVQQLGY